MDRDVDFLYEVGTLRLMPRQWSRFHMTDVANNAEHMFRVTWIALTIAAREAKRTGETIDTGKITKMALAHDMAETRVGDVDMMSRQYVDRHEEEAVQDMLAATSIGDEFIALLEEYEERKTIESKIVKDADNLDCDMELAEQAALGNVSHEDWAPTRTRVATSKLYTTAAKELYDEIWSTKPSNWYFHDPKNRLNGGDWKKK